MRPHISTKKTVARFFINPRKQACGILTGRVVECAPSTSKRAGPVGLQCVIGDKSLLHSLTQSEWVLSVIACQQQVRTREVRARLCFMSVLAYDWPVTAPQRTVLKTRLVLIVVALVVAGLAMGLHTLIQ